MDRLVGYSISPLLWQKVSRGLSAGRVQSVAVRLIVDREREIRAFVTKEYWTIAASLEHDGQGFTAKLHHIDGHKPEIPNEAAAQAILNDLAGRKTFDVTDIKRRERRKNPAAPFTTSTLQQEAAKKLGFGSKRTMRLAQNLYEGIELGKAEGAVGMITYMRTDSSRVAESVIRSVSTTESARLRLDGQTLAAAQTALVGQPDELDGHGVEAHDLGGHGVDVPLKITPHRSFGYFFISC